MKSAILLQPLLLVEGFHKYVVYMYKVTFQVSLWCNAKIFSSV